MNEQARTPWPARPRRTEPAAGHTQRRKPRWRLAAVVCAAALLAGACGADGTDAGGDPATLRVFGPYQGRQADRFAADLARWSAQSGIEVRYTGTGDFTTDLRRQIAELADPPDVAIVPQQGLVADLARRDLVREVPEPVAGLVRDSALAEAVELGTVDGRLVAVPLQVSVKSLVWYRPAVFDDLGLKVPTTLDELATLVDRVADAGVTPWCLAVEAQRATGWPATDWVEDLLVRLHGPEQYAAWVRGDTPFADPDVADAFDAFAELVLGPGDIAGGTRGALATATTRGHEPLLAEEPGCALYKQASFVWGFLPDGLRFGPDGDIDAFVLPGLTPDPPPLVVGGDLAIAFTDAPGVDDLLAFLAAGDVTSASAGYVRPLAPTGAADADDRPPIDRRIAELLVDAPVLVYDGSDAMDPAVGTDRYWQEITRWLAGAVTTEELAATLDAARAEPGDGG